MARIRLLRSKRNPSFGCQGLDPDGASHVRDEPVVTLAAKASSRETPLGTTMCASELDRRHLARALELAARGEGHVEPNPMVGCVLAADERVVGEGWHARFGGPHAEAAALQMAGSAARDTTAYVTLEPCCHFGKTPPCSEALIQAGIRRVVIAHADPFPRVAGGGIAQLRAAGIDVEVGLLEAQAARLNAPYMKRVKTGKPWVIAKWAMTLCGKIATHSGSSRWISGESSREVVHRLRGRVDAVMVGAQTAAIDDPQLTARPAGARQATRVIVDGQAALAATSRLVTTARETPLLVAASPAADVRAVQRLREAGCEVWQGQAVDRNERLGELLDELGHRQMTNVLVEGGAQLLGSLFDAGWIDEVHVFIATKVVGGQTAPSPLAGHGIQLMSGAISLQDPVIQELDGDLYIRGRLAPNKRQ